MNRRASAASARQVGCGHELLSTWRRFASIAGFLAVIVLGCGVTLGGPPPGAFLGIPGVYNYSPSALQIGNVQQFWWCAQALNPENHSQVSDTIQYASFNVVTHEMQGPITVLAETPGAWDSVYTCNPKVIGGIFTNPLGDGQTWSYAMYYVGTQSNDGNANSIGVAFSNDGVHWKKYSHPVIADFNDPNYGVAQPAVYNSDHKSGIWLFYEISEGSEPTQHIETTSSDGVHFTVVGTLTTNGIDPRLAQPSWGDMAYDAKADYWYAVFNLPPRNPSTTGNVIERGQAGVVLYRIRGDSLLSGASPWEQLKSFDSNLSGNEVLFLAGLLRDQYGTVNLPPYPTIQLFTSISDPAPPWDASPAQAGHSADPPQWDIATAQWAPNSPPLPLYRYANNRAHEVTTGWIDPSAHFVLQSTPGHLYEAPQDGATLAYYGCKQGNSDYFISTDNGCNGHHFLGIEGYGYSRPQSGLVPLYSCPGTRDHFVSHDQNCEGKAVGPGQLLGYAQP